MRLYLGWAARRQRETDWHEFYCLRPRIINDSLVMFEVVERRLKPGRGGEFWQYKLRGAPRDA